MALLVSLLTFAAPVVADTPHNVLVIYSYGRLLPGNIEVERGVAAGFASRPDIRVAVSYELLDAARFHSAEYEQVFVTYLREKYAQHPPEVIIVANERALDLVTRHRATLFPQVPIVHMGVSSDHLQSIPALPPDVVGTAITHDFVGTIEQAQRWHPRARRLVVVTGRTPWDRAWETRLRAEAVRLPRGLAVEYLAGLPIEELLSRLRGVPPDSIIYTPGFFRDDAGDQFDPPKAAGLIAAAAPSVPVYGPYATFVGTGAVGGRAVSDETVGRIAAETAAALLVGAAPSSLKPPATVPTPLQVDWRQLQRWGIPDSAVPAGSIVQFREPSLWEAYRNQVLVGGAVLLLQGGLILALLSERRRRQRTVTALVRSEEHMRLAARSAGLSTWVLEGEDGKDGGARAPVRAEDVPDAVGDFRDTLARIAPQDRAAVAAAVHAARDRESEFEVEYRIEAKDGAWEWQLARGRADRAKPPRLLGVAIDVTRRKRAELQAEQDRTALQHMTRVSLLGQLSASIAHQLNQPLASILGNAEAAQKMLGRGPLDVPELREICADLVTENHRAAQVIRRLTVLFKRGKALFEPLDVNDLARDTIELARSMLLMRHVSVVTQLAPALPSVEGDRVQLQQLLLNLVVNASDAMLSLPADRRVLTVQTASAAGAVHLRVSDRGPGVPLEAMDRVFEPFWSTRADGMGMGLAVCRAIAEGHRGSLAVRNLAVGGAEFCVRLPVAGEVQ